MRPVWFISATVPVVALAIASSINLPKKLIYNASESAPIGFYWVDQEPVSQGDYVFVRIPEQVLNLVESRQYLPPDVPLVKRVRGVSGDEICRINHKIFINKIQVSVALERDNLGRKLPQMSGCVVLDESQVFLLQDHPQSFDGRYFGPVNRALIIGRATKLQFPWRKHEPN